VTEVLAPHVRRSHASGEHNGVQQTAVVEGCDAIHGASSTDTTTRVPHALSASEDPTSAPNTTTRSSARWKIPPVRGNASVRMMYLHSAVRGKMAVRGKLGRYACSCGEKVKESERGQHCQVGDFAGTTGSTR
jgi:hypothetical protein